METLLFERYDLRLETCMSQNWLHMACLRDVFSLVGDMRISGTPFLQCIIKTSILKHVQKITKLIISCVNLYTYGSTSLVDHTKFDDKLKIKKQNKKQKQKQNNNNNNNN